jgi:hypothetical protein
VQPSHIKSKRDLRGLKIVEHVIMELQLLDLLARVLITQIAILLLVDLHRFLVHHLYFHLYHRAAVAALDLVIEIFQLYVDLKNASFQLRRLALAPTLIQAIKRC